jgi:hypothetical protein
VSCGRGSSGANGSSTSIGGLIGILHLLFFTFVIVRSIRLSFLLRLPILIRLHFWMCTAHMLPEMLTPEVAALATGSLATIGSTTLVNHLMSLHIRAIREQLSTGRERTSVRLLPSMYTNVPLEGRLLSKALTAGGKRAWKWFLPAMLLQVSLQ